MHLIYMAVKFFLGEPTALAILASAVHALPRTRMSVLMV